MPSSRSTATLSATDWKLVSITPAATIPGRKKRAALTPSVSPSPLNCLLKITENMLSMRIGKTKEKNTASFSRKYIFSSRTVRSQPMATTLTARPPARAQRPR